MHTPKYLLKKKQYSYEQRINAGLRSFKKEDLTQLAKTMFSGCITMTYQQMEAYLAKGLHGTDISDLIDVLVIKKIIKATTYPNYEL